MPRLTRRSSCVQGFSLVELLLVLALIGILSGIAIPAYLGQRRRAMMVGDAEANARVLAAALESRKAETGIYGPGGTTWTWTASGTAPTASAGAPQFYVKGASRMNYSVAVTNGGVSYTITVNDPSLGANVYTLDQAGAGSVLIKY